MKYLPPQTTRRMLGLTLAELLVSLFILTLLISSLGAFANAMLNSNRMVNTTNLMINDLNLARSSALNLGREVAICAANIDGSNCSGADSWNNGWLVYIDKNGNRSLDTDEQLLRQQGPLGGRIAIKGNISLNNDVWNSYQADGSVTYTGSYYLCNIDKPTNNRRIHIERVRRPYVSRGDATCP